LGLTSKGKIGVQGSGRARVGKGKKGGRDGEKGKKEGGRERWMEKRSGNGDTRHTNPSLLPVPLTV